MRSPIATLGVATALALACVPQPGAEANGVDDICVIITTGGVVTGTVGHCEPTTGTTHEFRYNYTPPTGVISIEIYIRYP